MVVESHDVLVVLEWELILLLSGSLMRGVGDYPLVIVVLWWELLMVSHWDLVGLKVVSLCHFFEDLLFCLLCLLFVKTD